MTTFTAGRFVAHVFLGPQNGRATTLVELHRNGSGVQVEMGRLSIDFDDLPDLKHVLDRAMAAHGATDCKTGSPVTWRAWYCGFCGGDSTTGHKPDCGIVPEPR